VSRRQDDGVSRRIGAISASYCDHTPMRTLRNAAVSLSALILLVIAGSSGRAQTPVAASPTRSIWDGVYTDAQAQRGQQLYAQHCSRCHGADLTGMAIIPPWPSGRDRTPALGVNLFNDFYYDLPLSDLVERIRISMPQDRPGSLDRKRTVDVVAYRCCRVDFLLDVQS